MRQTHRFGEKCFVDYSGERMRVIDRLTGEVRQTELFVGVLGGSNYTYAEATWTQELHNWLGSHRRMFEYFGGVPEITVPDNLKSGVKKADYYEPDINPSYNDLATHYGTAVIPARAYRPKDKAKAENGVLLTERWIIAALRNREFYSLDELNEAIGEKLQVLNNKRFQKLEGSRQSTFEQHEKALLRPLPSEPYEFGRWKKAKVNIDYHVEVDAHYYSVPHALIQETMDVRVTGHTVEILHLGQRVVSHRRSHVKGGHTTLPEHMPPKHAKM
jgi:transposase